VSPSRHVQTALSEGFISVYNLFYTSLPVLALGFFDQDVKPLVAFKVLHFLITSSPHFSSHFYFAHCVVSEAVLPRPRVPLLQLQGVHDRGGAGLLQLDAPLPDPDG
jgi:hypothetical protein